jgi:hypothetical protein
MSRPLSHLGLFKRRLQLQLCDQFHILTHSTNERGVQLERSAAFLRTPKGGAFLPPFL